LVITSQFDRLRVVLVRTRNPLNIGAVARAMSNLGFCHLRLVNPYEPSFREARSAVGASAILDRAEVYTNVGDAVADCALVVGTSSIQRRDPQQPVRRLETGARLIRKSMASTRVALLFGSEKVGLSNDDLSHCHWLLRIPTREQHGSMNLGQAVAVCLYELIRSVRPTEPEGKVLPASAADLERITLLLSTTLVASGYIKPRAATVTRGKLRRLVHRLQLSSDDAKLWLGMLRQVLWKLDPPRKHQ
jgi:TrmH family RNA methyltransferase